MGKTPHARTCAILWRCVFGVMSFCLAPAVAVASECREDTVWIKGAFGQARFTVEIADDEQERAIGLMNRASMPTSAGMLFIYDRPSRLSFWMRNTLIELDMLFVDSAGVIQNIHHRAIPLDETPIHGGAGLTHVLEINGGLAKTMGISVGDALRHPSFEKDVASWPC